MSKHTDLLTMHRRIERREFGEACRKIEELTAMLRQRDMILHAILARVGPQKLTQDDMAAVPAGLKVRCDAVEGENAMVFSAVGVEIQGDGATASTPAPSGVSDDATSAGDDGSAPSLPANVSEN